MESHPDGPFASNMWSIPLLPDMLPGRVYKKLGGGQLFIEPLVKGLPLTDGTLAQRFFAFIGDADIDDYVKFRWENPGEKGFNRAREEHRDPRAVYVQVVEEEEARQLAEDIRDHLATELRSQWEQKQDELQHERERVAQQAEELAQTRTQEFRDELNRNAESLAQRETYLNAERQYLDEQQKYLESLASSLEKAEHLWAALEPYRAAVPLVIDPKPSNPPDPCLLPDKLGTEWNEMLHSSGLPLPKYVGTSYLLALVSALYSGSLILLNGSVGVGKTSLINHSASLLGGDSKVIPVRPAWLDPSDLLGFFDPLNETFRPSPFLTALKDANNHSDRLHLVCLDELNLAKIENYGADLLSSLEYSRSQQGKQGLLLYSPSIEIELWEEARLLNEEQQPDSKQIQRLRRLQNLLKDYRSTFPIPRNLVVLGTLNADETTYDLSPKVIDRSFVITYPPAKLTVEGASEPLDPESILKQISVSTLTNEMKQIVGKTMDGWETVVKWNTQYLSKLAIPLGHRAKREYAVFSAATNYLGLTQDECLGYFLFTKVLPRISFFKGSASDNVNREELCSKWFIELEAYRDFGVSNILAQMQDQLDDDRRRNVRYWG